MKLLWKKCAIFTAVLITAFYIVHKRKSSKRFHHMQRLSPPQSKVIRPKLFEDTLIVMNFNYPFYENMKLLHELYDGVFGAVLSCGPPDNASTFGPDIAYKNESHQYFYRYLCLTKAIEKYPGFNGYLYSNDDAIINWWNMLKLDRWKVWQSGYVDFRQNAYGDILQPWTWWKSKMGLEACQKYYKELKAMAEKYPISDYQQHFEIYMYNSNGEPKCAKGWADVFYIPGRFTRSFVKLSHLAYQNKLFLEIAGNNIIRSLDKVENFEFLNGTYLPDLGIYDISARSVWKTYKLDMTFIHPVKLNSKISKDKELTHAIIRNWILQHKNTLLKSLINDTEDMRD